MGIIQGGKVIEGALERPVQDVSFTIGRQASNVVNVAIRTDGVILSEHTPAKHFTAISGADGGIDINIGHRGTRTWRLIAVLGSGRIKPSAAIRFE